MQVRRIYEHDDLLKPILSFPQPSCCVLHDKFEVLAPDLMLDFELDTCQIKPEKSGDCESIETIQRVMA